MAGIVRLMNGTDAKTGKPLTGLAHLRQSVRDILTTPIGTRVMRRDYGSRLFSLIDAPMNRATLLAIYAATVESLQKWEPRFHVEKTQAVTAEPGRVTLDVTGRYLPTGETVTLSGLEVR